MASCGLMCPQNHTCVARCGLVVASRACFPCKKNRIKIRGPLGIFVTLDIKQDSKVRRFGRHFATPQHWDGIWSQSEASSNKASNTGALSSGCSEDSPWLRSGSYPPLPENPTLKSEKPKTGKTLHSKKAYYALKH